MENRDPVRPLWVTPRPAEAGSGMGWVRVCGDHGLGPLPRQRPLVTMGQPDRIRDGAFARGIAG